MVTIAFVLVAVKKEPTAALALITSFRIFTNLVAVAIVGFTLVYICYQFEQESIVYYTLVKIECQI